jgi:hypothetical protein
MTDNSNKQTFVLVHADCQRQPSTRSAHRFPPHNRPLLTRCSGIDNSPRVAYATTLHLAGDGDGEAEGGAMRRAGGDP